MGKRKSATQRREQPSVLRRTYAHKLKLLDERLKELGPPGAEPWCHLAAIGLRFTMKGICVQGGSLLAPSPQQLIVTPRSETVNPKGNHAPTQRIHKPDPQLIKRFRGSGLGLGFKV